MRRRILSFLLAMLMLLTCLPMQSVEVQAGSTEISEMTLDTLALDQSVQGTPFELYGLNGYYKSESYRDNAVLLISGNSMCFNTLSLLSALQGNVSELRSMGVEVFVNVLDCSNDLALEESKLQEEYPEFCFTCGDSNLFWENLERVGYSGGSVTLPTVFLYDKDGMITHYSIGYVYDVDALLGEVYAVATNNPLPVPSEYPKLLTQPVEGISFYFEGIGGTYTYEEYAENGVMVIFSNGGYEGTYDFLTKLNSYAKDLKQAGVEIIVNLLDCPDSESVLSLGVADAYPDMHFTYSDGAALWDMLSCVDFQGEYVNLPVVFVYNEDGMITYYSIETPRRFQDLIDAAYENVSEVKEDVTAIFHDVNEWDWFKEAVQYVYDNGIMSGYNGGFDPNGDMTRAMMVTTLYRMAGAPKVTDYTVLSVFSDVQAGQWYTDAVAWAYNEEITTGYLDRMQFGVDDEMTREQLATFMFRYANKCGYDVSTKADITGYVGYTEISDYAVENMSWAVGAGLISGVELHENGTTVYDLQPKESATRAQLATILKRFCE